MMTFLTKGQAEVMWKKTKIHELSYGNSSRIN